MKENANANNKFSGWEQFINDFETDQHLFFKLEDVQLGKDQNDHMIRRQVNFSKFVTFITNVAHAE